MFYQNFHNRYNHKFHPPPQKPTQRVNPWDTTEPPLDLGSVREHRGATSGGSRRPPMMYFTPLKTAVILGLCLLGAILCIPNLFPAPAPWA